MKDSFGREIRYLRVSVTQRCNLNCVYCGSERPDTNELTSAEIEKIVRAFVKTGVSKVRLTGGEPLVRRDIGEIAEKIKKIEGVKKLVLTTNGVGLYDMADSLKKAGVDRVNVSLDSLDREKYKKLTGRDALPVVLSGIDKALSAGLSPVRINSVLIRGQNDNEAENLIELARDRAIDVRFIELMPFSDTGEDRKLVVKGEEILKRFPFLKPADSGENGSVAAYFTADGYKGKIGFISPVSNKFCSECNRVRLLSDGKVRPCLGHDSVYDLMPYINEPDRLLEEVRKAIYAKPMGHSFECLYGNSHAMNKIGG